MQEAQAYADEKKFHLPRFPPRVSLYILKTWVQKNTQLGFISQYILVICSLSVDIKHLIF